MVFLQKMISGFLLLAFFAWFFISMPSISPLTFSPTQDTTLVSTEHLKMTENEFGTMFQEISFEGVVMRFIVHVAEDIAFASTADQSAVQTAGVSSLFDLAMVKFQEKMFLPFLGIPHLTDLLLVFVGVSMMCVYFFGHTRELLGIFSLLARGRKGEFLYNNFVHHNNKYFSK